MATAATERLTRTGLIRRAFRRLGVLQGNVPTADQHREAVELLNTIVREENDRAKKNEHGTHLWKEQTGALPLVAGQGTYRWTSTTGALAGPLALGALAPDVDELLGVTYRDLGGADRPLELVNADQWHRLPGKRDTGEPECAWLEELEPRQHRLLHLWPVPVNVGTPSRVLFAGIFVCILGHVASVLNRPAADPSTAGPDAPRYWSRQGANVSTAWAAGTTYTHGATLLYRYKKPLETFHAAGDNPDFPESWERFLFLRLAYDLAPSYHLDLQERGAIAAEAAQAYDTLFPASTPKSTAVHNKALFF